MQRLVFGAVEALPVPDADLLGGEPDRRPGRIRLHRKAAEDKLQVHEVIAFLRSQRPERPAVVLLDLAGDTDIGEVRLDDLRRRQALGLVEDVERDAEARRPGLFKKGTGLVRIVVVGHRVAVARQARRDDPVADRRRPEIGGIHHDLAVDGMLDGAPDPNVLKRRDCPC